MNKSIYYIAYSFIEDENSANQIQSKNTFENLKKIKSSFKGIFLGNQKRLFWNIRKEGDKYFIDRIGYKLGIIEKYLKIGILRKNLFPHLFAWKTSRILKKDRNKKNIYTRLAGPEEGIFYLKRLNELNINRIVFELHNLSFDISDFYYWNFEKKYCYRKYVQFFDLLKQNSVKTQLVTITKKLTDIVRNRFDYKQNIEIIPDAHNFISDKPKNINFNKEKIEMIYTGLAFRNRGVEIAVKALEFLPDNFYLRLIGGKKHERENLRKKYHFFVRQQRLILEEPVSHSKVKEKLINADIAILPTPANGFSNSTSPLKLFDYMSVGLPIVASNTPVFKEILTEDSALFFEPKDSDDLAQKIKYLARNQKLAKKNSKNVFHDSKKYTYLERAKKIYNLF